MTSPQNFAHLRPSFFAKSGWLFAAVLQLCSVEGLSCQLAEDPSPHSAAVLIPESRSVRPGEPFTVGLRITLDPGWHSYWLNPGDAGQPASIDWKLPAGFRAGEIQWPYPQTVEESSVVSYGYDGEVLLLTEITPPRFMTTGQTVKFSAQVRWLVCEDICLPASADLDFEMHLTDESPDPDARWQSAFAETRSRLPTQVDGWEIAASQNDETIILQITPANVSGLSFEGAHFFPSERGVIDHGAPQVLTQEQGVARIVLRKSQFLRAPLLRLRGVLVMPDFMDIGAGRMRALSVDAAVADSAVNEVEPGI